METPRLHARERNGPTAAECMEDAVALLDAREAA
ncbi:MAG: hypothetical protein AVDCRST_MAG31-464 [uncultured Sphingomonas sp.]|uniref:Uncharacterized protein n=1 Tax=uncultured Sphingomonas sp. TaxID=158754 RepID=A0A6J4SLH8_9SPHN|nr:MAG: hypothetical protein AVDCRST_MAG31-464 [uncultured Sphingomonas sp.]